MNLLKSILCTMIVSALLDLYFYSMDQKYPLVGEEYLPEYIVEYYK